MDQFYMVIFYISPFSCITLSHCLYYEIQHHPHKLYSQPMSDIAIDIENPITLEGHLQCAALEKPIDLSKDLVYFGQTAESVCMEHLKRDPSDPVSSRK
jgi:ATP-dependent helicase YprA (DUF1998 family)